MQGALGTTDGTFKNYRYFTCEDGYGLFVSISRLSPATDKPTSIFAECTDRIGTEASKLSYSDATQRDGPAQHTLSKSDRPNFFRAASHDGFPSLPPQSPGRQPSTVPDTAKTEVPKLDTARNDSPKFQLHQRVMFYDTKGDKHYGTVGWMGRASTRRKFDYTIIVGIITVSLN